MFEPDIAGGANPAITSLVPFGRALFRCRETDIDRASQSLGIALPREACRSVHGGALSALWLGPDEWLIVGTARADGWVSNLSTRLDGVLCSLVDISHRQIALSVHGPRAEEILASGCALDLSIAAFPVGMCTRTMFAKTEIVLWRTGPDYFHLEVWRSFAPYLEALLREAESEA
ncbi:sarcosine oxidase subunit gamma [Sphingopyxis panaciterrae]